MATETLLIEQLGTSRFEHGPDPMVTIQMIAGGRTIDLKLPERIARDLAAHLEHLLRR